MSPEILNPECKVETFNLGTFNLSEIREYKSISRNAHYMVNDGVGGGVVVVVLGA